MSELLATPNIPRVDCDGAADGATADDPFSAALLEGRDVRPIMFLSSRSLMAHQVDAVRWMLERERRCTADGTRGGVLADETGVGKCAEIIALICYDIQIYRRSSEKAERQQTLVVAPNTLVSVWVGEFRKFCKRRAFGGISVGVCTQKSGYVLPDTDVVVTSYNAVTHSMRAAQVWGKPKLPPPSHSDSTPAATGAAERRLAHRKTKSRRPDEISVAERLTWPVTFVDALMLLRHTDAGDALARDILERYDVCGVLRRDARTGLLVPTRPIFNTHGPSTPPGNTARATSAARRGARLARQSLHGRPWLRIVLDEVHCTRTETTQAARACHMLYSEDRTGVDDETRAGRRWGVSATLVGNSSKDVMSTLAFLRHRLATSETMRKTPCDAVLDGVLRTYSMRRTHADVQLAKTAAAPRSPPPQPLQAQPQPAAPAAKTVDIDYILLDFEHEGERAAYRSMLSELRLSYEAQQQRANSLPGARKRARRLARAAAQSNAPEASAAASKATAEIGEATAAAKRDTQAVLAAICYLRQLCVATCLPTGTDERGYKRNCSWLANKWSSTDSTKIRAVMRYLRECVAPDEKLVVFARWRGAVKLLRRRLTAEGVGVLLLTGDMKPAKRRSAVHAFQTLETARVIIVSPDVGGMGVTLVRANHAILMDPWWNPHAENQCAGRVNRIGQTRNVHVRFLLVRDTIDIYIAQIAAAKIGAAARLGQRTDVDRPELPRSARMLTTAHSATLGAHHEKRSMLRMLREMFAREDNLAVTLRAAIAPSPPCLVAPPRPEPPVQPEEPRAESTTRQRIRRRAGSAAGQRAAKRARGLA